MQCRFRRELTSIIGTKRSERSIYIYTQYIQCSVNIESDKILAEPWFMLCHYNCFTAKRMVHCSPCYTATLNLLILYVINCCGDPNFLIFSYKVLRVSWIFLRKCKKASKCGISRNFNLFSQIYSTCKIPEQLKVAKITPIYLLNLFYKMNNSYYH